MVDNIATLGLQVDSRQVTTATTALTGLAGAAKATTPAVAAMEKATTPANAALAAMKGHTDRAASAHAAFSTQAMSAAHAVRSMAEGIAMGMPPTQILAQQMSHLSYAASGPGGLKGAFSEVGAMLSRFISPTTAVVAGLAAIGAGSVFVLSKIAATEKGFGELAERSTVTVQALHALASAAATEGIGSPEFLKGVTHFNELSVEANHNIGALAELFHANNTAIGTTAQNMSKVADLIHNTRSEQDKYRILQELGLPATREWVQFLGQGADKLREATAQAVKFGDVADERLIAASREFDKAWNTAWENFSTAGKKAFVEVYDALSRLNSSAFGDISRRITNNARSAIGINATGGGKFNEAFSAVDSYKNSALHAAMQSKIQVENTAPTKTTADAQREIAIEQQRIGLLGQTATVEQQERLIVLQLNAAHLAGVDITAKQRDNLVRLAHERALGIDQIHASTDSLHTEISAFGLDTGAAAAYVAVQTKINEAKRLGVPLSAENIAQLRRESVALGDATTTLERMRDAQSVLGSAMKDFRTQIQQGASGWTALRSAAMVALNAIEDKLIDIAAKKLVAAAFGSFNPFSLFAGGSAPGVGPTGPVPVGHMGGMVGELQGSRYIHPAYFDYAPRYHMGGIVSGEVPAILQKGEGVFTPKQMAALAPANRGGNITIAPNITVQHTGGTGDDAQAAKLATSIAASVRSVALDVIRDQKRPGGILS